MLIGLTIAEAVVEAVVEGAGDCTVSKTLDHQPFSSPSDNRKSR